MLTSVGGVTRLEHDGDDLVTEYNNGDQVTRRFVHGPGTDEALVWYEGSGTADRRWLLADERGSIISVANSSGTAIGVNRYDEYGQPATTNVGRFQYTGQVWLSELGLYDYKSRMYQPTIGRFMQTDPIGYDAGPNLYAYVGGDPVNMVDPSGLYANTPPVIQPPKVPYNPNEWGPWDGVTQGTCRTNLGGGHHSSTHPCIPGDPGPSSGGAGSVYGNGVGGGGAGKQQRLMLPRQEPQRSRPSPDKPKPNQLQHEKCSEYSSEATGFLFGTGALAAVHTPDIVTGGVAIGRGARIGAVVSELAGPEAVPFGLIIGGVVGGAIYLYDIYHNQNISRNIGTCSK